MSFVAVAVGIGGAVAGIGGGLIASSGAKSAANTQSNAALSAAQIQANQDQKALDLQREEFNTQQQNLAPWLATGTSGLANLSSLLGLLPPKTNSTTTGTPAPATAATFDPSKYSTRSFNDLVNSGDPNISPNIETSRMWQQNGVPYTVIQSSDGRSVGVRTDLGGANSTIPNNTTQAAPATDLSSLVNPSLGAPGSLLQPWTGKFVAPTDVTEQNDPGYQFRLAEGEKALQRSAAARGNLLTGDTAKAIGTYAQNDASNEYQNTYNRALQQYQQGYNEFQNNQTNTFNRLAALSGVGQTAAAQENQASQNLANAGSNILVNSGNQQSNAVNNAAAARASGYVASGNILGSTLSGLGNNLQQSILLHNIGTQSSNPYNLNIGDIGLPPGVTPTQVYGG